MLNLILVVNTKKLSQLSISYFKPPKFDTLSGPASNQTVLRCMKFESMAENSRRNVFNLLNLAVIII